MKLSKTTRIKGFIICFVVGILLSVLGSFALFLKGLTTYGVLYTLGNIISLASTCFLMGPVNQLKKMFASTRIIATIIVFVSFGLTLYAALGLHNPILALVFILIQSFAMLWYSLSYIPYARDAVKKTVEAIIA
ncbi:vesicle transport protein SFT2B isoform X2 [Trichogramma pretiosum]|nr:vesicle transport protein SFT2B isoform X2 [Trichogramma pretiosum]